MIRIRLARHGSKHRPVYWVVLADARSPRDGKFLCKLGFYNPLRSEVSLDLGQIEHYQARGAQISKTVSHLLKQYIKNT